MWHSVSVPIFHIFILRHHDERWWHFPFWCWLCTLLRIVDRFLTTLSFPNASWLGLSWNHTFSSAQYTDLKDFGLVKYAIMGFSWKSILFQRYLEELSLDGWKKKEKKKIHRRKKSRQGKRQKTRPPLSSGSGSTTDNLWVERVAVWGNLSTKKTKLGFETAWHFSTKIRYS